MDVGHLISYYQWADEQLMPAIEAISDEHFTKSVGTGWSLRELVEHYVVSYDYLVLSGKEIRTRMDELAIIDRKTLIQEWDTSLATFCEAVLKVEGEQKMPISKDKSVTLDRDNYLLMYTDHITYHRGQMTQAMKSMGYDGVNTDYYSVLLQD